MLFRSPSKRGPGLGSFSRADRGIGGVRHVAPPTWLVSNVLVHSSNSCLEKSHGQKSLEGYSSWGREEIGQTYEAGLTRKFETSHVGGATCRTPPIPRSALEKEPRPGPLFEGNPVGEGTTRRGTATPVLSRLVIPFLPRSKHLLISWLQSPSTAILEPKKIKSVTVSIFPPFICHEVIVLDASHDLSFF